MREAAVDRDAQRAKRVASWLALGFVVTIVMLPVVLYVTLRSANDRQLRMHGQEITSAVASIRDFYTTTVVGRAIAAGGQVVLTDDYRSVHGGIPIPATFSVEIGELFGTAHGDGDDAEFSYAFVSDYPFAQRDRRPLDAFESEALTFFRNALGAGGSSSNEAYGTTGLTFEMSENPLFGKQVHRHATPVIMLQACVDCHNSHPDSPRRDWRVGDVRGIEVVSVSGYSLSGAADFRLVFPYLGLLGVFAVGTVSAFRRTALRLERVNGDLEQARSNEATTARDLAEKVDQLALLGAVADRSVFGVTIADARQPDNPLVYANQAFYDLTGFAPDQVIGVNCRFLRGPDTDPEASRAIREAIERGVPATVELLNYRRDGSTFWNRFTIFPVTNDAGELAYFVGYQIDVTAQRDAEAERAMMLAEVQEAQRHESLGVLVAGVAHEINNPLGIALTAASHAGNSIDDVLSRLEARGHLDDEMRDDLEDEREALRLVRANLARAANLVRDFKDVASDRSQPSRRVVDLADYLRTVAGTLTPMLHREGVQLLVEAPNALEVEIDTGAFGQLITNLVVNAVVHAFEGVSERLVRIEARAASEAIVEVRVCDSGRGIDATARLNLFTPFFTTRRGQGGTGLGLYIAKSIAQRSLGGDLVYEPSDTKGAVFVLSFPAFPEARS